MYSTCLYKTLYIYLIINYKLSFVLSHVQLFCNPTDCGSPGSSAQGISQARMLEWLATSFSRGSSRPKD